MVDQHEHPVLRKKRVLLGAIRVVDQDVENIHQVVLRRNVAPARRLQFLLEHVAQVDRVVDPELEDAAAHADLPQYRNRHHVKTDQAIELVGRQLVVEPVRLERGARTATAVERGRQLLEDGAQLHAVLAQGDALRIGNPRIEFFHRNDLGSLEPPLERIVVESFGTRPDRAWQHFWLKAFTRPAGIGNAPTTILEDQRSR